MTRRGLDRPLITAVVLLATLGLLTIFSAGQTDAPTVVAGIWRRQLIWVAIGIVAAAGAFRLSPRMLEWLSPSVYLVALLLLVVALVAGTGAGTAAGTKSWIAIGGVRVGQPAEFAKLATILILARYLSGLRDPPNGLRAVLPAGMLVVLPFALVALQPDLGSAIVFLGIFFAALYWGGVRPAWLLLLASPLVSLMLAFSTVAWSTWIVFLTLFIILVRPYVLEGLIIWGTNTLMGVIALGLWAQLKPYQQNRLLSFLNPEIDPRATGWHIIQSKIAIGSGGLLGSGFTEGTQKRLAFLPAQHTDFIYSVVGEELGFVGVVVTLALFAWLILILLRIAREATEPFSSMLVFGIAGMLIAHIIVNIGMTVGVMPITGIPLPFFSYGGSFFVTCALAVGIALRVSWDSRGLGYVPT